MNNLLIRPTLRADLPALAAIADVTGLFPGDMLAGMVAPALAGDPGAIWLTASDGEQPVGLCFAETEAFTEGVWNMRAIGVHPAHHRQGVGSGLIDALEAALGGNRLLIVETSDGAAFANARAFYVARAYREVARIDEFWAPGEAKVIFAKTL